VHGQLWNASQLASAFGVSVPTVGHYLDLLEATFMVRRLLPLEVNLKKRLVKSPKVYVRDSGLLHCWLGISSELQLQGHPQLGASWEGWVREQIAAVLPLGWQMSFYRTAVGAEIDVVLHHGSRRVAVEIKFSSAPKPARGFWQALEDLHSGPGQRFYYCRQR
jgi:predicted AAA+ superfamily ATPase